MLLMSLQGDIDRNGYKMPPKSACIGCPYHDNAQWRDAVEFDKGIRNNLHNVTMTAYVHRSLVPLNEVDLSTERDRGQMDLFGNECEGMCGV